MKHKISPTVMFAEVEIEFHAADLHGRLWRQEDGTWIIGVQDTMHGHREAAEGVTNEQAAAIMHCFVTGSSNAVMHVLAEEVVKNWNSGARPIP